MSPQDSPVVAGRTVEPHERVADDHVFFWKAVIAEPCYWDSKASSSVLASSWVVSRICVGG